MKKNRKMMTRNQPANIFNTVFSMVLPHLVKERAL